LSKNAWEQILLVMQEYCLSNNFSPDLTPAFFDRSRHVECVIMMTYCGSIWKWAGVTTRCC